MRVNVHPTRICLLFAIATSAASATFADDDELSALLKEAPAATAPAPTTAPSAAHVFDATAPNAANTSATGTILLSDGTTLQGHISTTPLTPLRVWVEESKRYLDIDLADIRRLQAHLISQGIEEEWHWLKEGSDQKVYTGKKYPVLDLSYVITLLNGQTVEGTIVAPIIFNNGKEQQTLALNKKLKGQLSEAPKDVLYMSSITLDAPAPDTPRDNKITKLPLLPE